MPAFAKAGIDNLPTSHLSNAIKLPTPGAARPHGDAAGNISTLWMIECYSHSQRMNLVIVLRYVAQGNAAVKRAGGPFRGSWIETFLQNGQFSSFFSSAFVGCGGAAGCDSAWGGASSSSILRTTRGVTSNIR